MTKNEIQSYLRTNIFGREIHCFDSLDSTNIFAKSLAQQEAPEGTLVIAEEQTMGKGRLGRTWQSEKGKNLTFSVILKPNLQPDHIGIISLYAGVAVAEAIRTISGCNAECKWPNDILIDTKKICGILSESVFMNNSLSAVIVGIGINVNQSEFPPELQSKASSLFLSAHKSFDRFTVLASVLERMEHHYTSLQNGDVETILTRWRELSPMIGTMAEVQQHDNKIKGRVKGISSDGSLIVEQNGTEINIHAGDVTIISS